MWGFMKNLFLNIKTIKENVKDDVIVMYSTGKDATCMLDLFAKYIGVERLRVVYLYFIKDISFKNSYLKEIEKRYKIKIDQFPHHELTQIIHNRLDKKVKVMNQSDMQNFLRLRYNTSWIAWGYRINESVNRAQMIRAEAPKGIDIRNKKLYPVADWNEKEVLKWLRNNKIPLSVEYSYNFHDLNMPFNETLEWLFFNYPNDYYVAVKQFPFLEGDLLKWQMRPH